MGFETPYLVTVAGAEETNYYPLDLTAEGRARIDDGGFDDNEPALRALMEAIRLPNTETFARKKSWDNIEHERLSLIRLTNADMMYPFNSVTIMGDEFLHSMMAIGFEHRFGVRFQPHPDWRPARKRKTPLAERANIFYFATKNERRGSLTYFDSDEVVPKLVGYVEAQHKGQSLITTNTKYKKQFFEPVKAVIADIVFAERVVRRTTETAQQILWVEPKKSGTNAYISLCNVAFFAAMRPSGDEIASMTRSLGITEEEIIRWREYNTLYQFIMRCNLRDYDSNQVCNVYVFDEWQAEYLRERFGGCKTFKHVKDVIDPGPATNGRPRSGLTAAERKRRQRAKKKAKAQAYADACNEAADAIDPKAKLDELIKRKYGK